MLTKSIFVDITSRFMHYYFCLKEGRDKVPASCPVLFQTPGGLYLRKVRYNHHPTAPGFTYCACDIEPDRIQKSDTLDKMDLFMRSSAFYD